MTASPSIKLADLAKAAGVSQGTASNVFNQPQLVRDEVRAHVLEVAASIGYAGPDPKGRMLRAGKVNAIGVATAYPLTYFFEDPFARVLMEGISAACQARGAGLSLISVADRRRLAWSIESALVDGFVLFCIEDGERLVELTRARHLPFVALALGKTDLTVPAVGVDDRAGAKLAAEHMITLGHRRFGVLSVEFIDNHSGPITPLEVEATTMSTAKDRLVGYFAALAAGGVATDDLPIYETLNDPVTVTAGLEWLFARPHPPTALLCMSDRIALIAMDWLRAHSIRVPEDVSVIGFDGIREGANASPPLTTVAQPIAEIGRRAIEIVLDGGRDVRRETLPLELIVRASTAPPKA
jgi:DNA-binding LacI/PurR family transcriptional regulator